MNDSYKKSTLKDRLAALAQSSKPGSSTVIPSRPVQAPRLTIEAPITNNADGTMSSSKRIKNASQALREKRLAQSQVIANHWLKG